MTKEVLNLRLFGTIIVVKLLFSNPDIKYLNLSDMRINAFFTLFLLSLLISCERISGDKIWATINETQCSNGWDNIDAADAETRVRLYLESKDIEIFEIKIETYSYGPFCEACFCPSGRRIKVLIPESDLDALKKLGFGK